MNKLVTLLDTSGKNELLAIRVDEKYSNCA